VIKYALPGDKEYQQQLYPEPNPDGVDDPNRLDPRLGLKTYNDVIAHFTKSSLERDGIEIEHDSLSVTESARGYTVSFEPKLKFATEAKHFKKRHVQMLDHEHAGLALRGVEECRKTPAWDPMAGYKVKPTQPKSQWRLFLPLGLPIVNHRAVTLLHYPPTIAYRNADYFKAPTAQHWMQVVKCCVPPDVRPECYQLIIDVDPIAAPGAGESEYENDYFPINLTSLFFDNDKKGLTYVRSMLELMLNPPHNEGNPYTLPLLVGGSPEYDPQAPGWFRTRYTKDLRKDENGIPMANVLQVGFIHIKENSKKETPYIIANHMAAAGVEGKCTDDPSKIPNIQKYEAQDLVAATFLTEYAKHKEIHPTEAKKDACRRWFGATEDSGAPNPPKEEDRLAICALAQLDQFLTQVDQFFVPKYRYQEAIARCQRRGGPDYSPCFGSAYVPPGDPLPWEDTAMGLQPVRGDYLICRSTEKKDYSVWRVDIDRDQVRFSCMPGQEGAEFSMPGQEWAKSSAPGQEGTHFDLKHPNPPIPQLISIGNYILEWGPITLEDYIAQNKIKGVFFYRLIKFDPSARDPLGSFAEVQKGFWNKQKFWGGRPDFGNPQGAAKEYDKGDKLMLVPLGTFVLNIIPTTGRGTFKLFNFDPGSNDPLTDFPTMIHGSFETIQFGHELIPLGNYVLDRVIDPKAPADEKGKYWLWSFDPMNATPLARPAIQTGRWHDIDENHQLIPIGEHVIDWDMKRHTYRLLRFDPESRNPKSTNPLAETGLHGPMPKEFHAEMTLHGGIEGTFGIKGNILTGFQGLCPIDQKKKKEPGTFDFMRTKIRHVVFYMLENCSFDHVCGWLYEKGEDGINFVPPIPPGCDRPPFKGAKHAQALGCDFNLNPDDLDAEGAPKKVHLEKFKYKGGQLPFLPTDPYHDMTDTIRQFFFQDCNGYVERKTPTMSGFVWNQGNPEVMKTFTPEQLPVLNGLANAFAVSDEWFCSMPGATDSQRAFALTGSALGQLNNFMNGPQYAHWPDNPHRPSIWKVLWANGITDWKIYNSVMWPRPPDIPFVLTYHLFLEAQIASVDAKLDKYIATVDQFKEDAQTGNLPSFSFLEPVWIMSEKPATSYHPAAEDGKTPGEIALNEIYEALKTGSKWNETLLIITFDEHGGLFDHVPPPYAQNPWPHNENDGFKYDLMGVRVPTILVSPWIKEHTVFRSPNSVSYDSTSIPATLLSWYGIPKARWGLGERAYHAPTFEGVFQCESPRNDAPELQPPPSAGTERTERIRSLHQEMAWRMMDYAASRIGNKGSREAGRIADEVLRKATDVDDLWRRMNDLLKSFKQLG
jgi:phospholipase C